MKRMQRVLTVLIAFLMIVSLWNGKGYAKKSDNLSRVEQQQKKNNTLNIDIHNLKARQAKGVLKEGSKAIRNTAFLFKVKGKSTKWYNGTTDSQGHFIARVPDGDYVVKAVKENGSSMWSYTSQSFTIKKGQVKGTNKNVISLKSSKNTLKRKKETANPNLQGVLTEGNHGVKGDLIIFNYGGETSDEEIFTVSSKGNGSFSASLPNGEYEIYGVSQEDGFYLSVLDFSVQNNQVFIGDQKQSSIEISLPKKVHEGLVFDGGAPLGQAEVMVEKMIDEDYGQFVQAAITGNNGKFKLRQLEDGQYFVSIYHQTFEAWQYVELEVVNGKIYQKEKQVSSIEIKVPKINLQGSVREGIHNIANAQLMIERYEDANAEDPTEGFSIPVNKLGKFEYRLPDGKYRIGSLVEENRETPVNVPFTIENTKLMQEGKPVTSLTVNLPPVTFTGRLTEQGKQIEGELYVSSVSGNQDIEYSAYPNADSEFSLRLTDGMYRVDFVYLYADNENVPMSLEFEMKDGKIYVDGQLKNMLDIEVPPVTLHGVVYDGDQLIHEGEVAITSGEGEEQSYYWKMLNENGTFTLRLPDGVYNVDEVYDGQGTPAKLNKPFEIRNGKLFVGGQLKETLDIHLPPVTLQGMLIENGAPLLGDIVIGSVENSQEPYWGSTEEEGIFKFRLPDGKYEVISLFLNDGSTFESGMAFEIKSGKLYVNANQQDTLQINVAPVTVTGTVYDGKEIVLDGNITVKKLDEVGEFNLVGSWINYDGNYNFRLPDGNYELRNVELYNEDSMENIEFNKPFVIKSGKVIMNGMPVDRLVLHLEDGTRQSVE